jgi:hypothetical protein
MEWTHVPNEQNSVVQGLPSSGQAVPLAAVTQAPLTHVWQVPQAGEHFEGAGGGSGGAGVVCVALCFLAFLKHFFFWLPDFFLHAVRAS